MKLKPLTAYLFLCLLAALPGIAQAEESDRPNIILILTDDMRNDHASILGHPYLETPQIDRLAKEGTIFERAYVTAPLCGPSRGSILTGLLPGQHNTRNHVDITKKEYPDGPFLPGVIQDLGYRTAMVGKWFQGQNLRPRPEFDRWFINHGVQQERDATPQEKRQAYLEGIYARTNYSVDGKNMVTGNYNTDDMFDEATRFSLETAESGQPFFLFLSPLSPHYPFVPAERHAGTYEGKGIPPRPNLDLDALKPVFRERDAKWAPAQSEMMLSVDEGIGQLLDALAEAGELDNTLIILTSDNGFLWGEHGDRTKNVHWEEAIRVPFIVRYPALYEAGTRSDRLVSLADLLPSFIKLAGGEVPEGLYGRSFLPCSLEREEIVSLAYDLKEKDPSTPLFASLVKPDRKVTFFADDRPAQLYRVSEDPYELEDIAKAPATSETLAQMREELAAILGTYGDPAEAAMVTKAKP